MLEEKYEKRIIVPLDFSTTEESVRTADRLVGTGVDIVKVGLQLATSVGTDVARLFAMKGFRVFLDLKFHDIPNTVGRAAEAASALGVWAFNVHASAGVAAMREAASYKGRSLLLAVTVLTSLDEDDCLRIYGPGGVKQKVYGLARDAAEAGCDGIICSPREIGVIREDPNFDSMLLVTPGVRPEWYGANDQKRVMTPREAMAEGADYLVIGRPLTKPPSTLRGPADAAGQLAVEMEMGAKDRESKPKKGAKS